MLRTVARMLLAKARIELTEARMLYNKKERA